MALRLISQSNKLLKKSIRRKKISSCMRKMQISLKVKMIIQMTSVHTIPLSPISNHLPKFLPLPCKTFLSRVLKPLKLSQKWSNPWQRES
jgi:hypothetical protein